MDNWITVGAVQDGYKQLRSDQVEKELPRLISEAQGKVRTDLSGTINMRTAEDIRPFPQALIDLALYKTRQKALIFYYQDANNADVVFNRDEYNDTVKNIQKGNIQIYEAEKESAGSAQGELG